MIVDGAVFGRSQLARLLDIDEWQLANFASRRYRYGLAPSVRRGAKGRGKKGLYSLGDVYKIALARRLLLVGFESGTVADVLRGLFPKGSEPLDLCSRQRPSERAGARYLTVDFSGAAGRDRKIRPSVSLRPKESLVDLWAEQLRLPSAAFIMDFDGLLAWVDSRILGREVGLEPGARKDKESPNKK